jgi:hypothetical protein
MERHAAHTPRKRWRCGSDTIILGIFIRLWRISSFLSATIFGGLVILGISQI